MVLVQNELKNAYIGIPYPESISLDKNSINLNAIGQTEQLTATIEPTVSDKTITWTSSDNTIATVDSTGLVTCVTPGTCTITATTDNGLTAICGVTNGWKPGVHTYMYRPLLANANDGSGNSRNGTVNGTVTWNNGAVFNANAQISTGLSTMPSNFTISIWVNKASASSEDTLFARWGGGDRYRFGMYFNSSKNLYVYQCTSYTDGRWVLVGNYGYGTWKNIVFTRSSGNEIKVYVDGSYVVNADYAYWTDGTGYLGIGGWTASQWNFHGTLKDFIVEDKTRTAQEVSDYYDQTKSNYGL